MLPIKLHNILAIWRSGEDQQLNSTRVFTPQQGGPSTQAFRLAQGTKPKKNTEREAANTEREAANTKTKGKTKQEP